MGVPRFYRWLVERYPMITTDVDPEKGVNADYENFYVDLNAIIHHCTHANVGGLIIDMNEEVVMNAVFEYIDILFALVKPTKMLYLAIDGVAPRAKMNQQRSRRYKSGEEWKKEVEELGIDIETTKLDVFDSNVITPGTEFMGRIYEHLKYFVASRIKTDIAWRRVDVVLSGDRTPGEGEHKIFDYIRRCRAKNLFTADSTHCIYGLDADLIMMALLTHEPYFGIIREEVTFSFPSKNARKIKQRKKALHLQKFQLIHITILREYLAIEFEGVGEFERVIEDMVFISYSLGNDFVPGLPYLEILRGGMNYYFAVYKKHMADFPFSYIICEGKINWGRYLVFLNEVAKYEKILVPMLAKKSDRRQKNAKKQRELEEFADLTIEEDEGDDLGDELEPIYNEHSEFDNQDFHIESINRVYHKFNFKQVDINAPEEVHYDKELYEAFKLAYYKRKFGIDITSESGKAVLKKIVLDYLKSVQWIWEYYYNGLISWSWFYDFHFTPFLSDILRFTHSVIESTPFEFAYSEPSDPIFQLLCVLPPASFRFIPKPYLVVLDEDALAEWFPTDVRVDMEGKRYDWEGVAMMPFIDVVELRKKYDAVDTSTIPEDVLRRNTLERAMHFTYNPDNHETLVNILDEIPDIVDCVVDVNVYTHVATETGSHDHLCPERFEFIPKLREGVSLGVDTKENFPTISRKEFKTSFKYGLVRVFQFNSQQVSLILEPLDKLVDVKSEDEQLREIDHVLGRIIKADWPHENGYFIYSVETATLNLRCVYEMRKGANFFYKNRSRYVSASDLLIEDIVCNRKAPSEIENWTRKRTQLKATSAQLGIELNNIQVILHGFPIAGRWISSRGEVKRMLRLTSVELPINLCDVSNPEEFQQRIRIEQTPAVGSKGVLLRTVSGPSVQLQSGYPVEYVGEVDDELLEVRVELLPKIDISGMASRFFRDEMHRVKPLNDVSTMLQMRVGFLSRLLSSVIVRDLDLDLGLRMKYGGKNLHLPGYIFQKDNMWYLTEQSIGIIVSYLQRFSDAIGRLKKVPYEKYNNLNRKDLYPELDYKTGQAKLLQLATYVDSLPHTKVEFVPSSMKELSKRSIAKIEEIAGEFNGRRATSRTVDMKLKRSLCYFPVSDVGASGCNPHFLFRRDAHFEIGDRMVNVAISSKIPFGMYMTVVGVGEDDIEVIFDDRVICASDLNGLCSPLRGAVLPKTSLIYKLPGSPGSVAKDDEPAWNIAQMQQAQQSQQKHLEEEQQGTQARQQRPHEQRNKPQSRNRRRRRSRGSSGPKSGHSDGERSSDDGMRHFSVDELFSMVQGGNVEHAVDQQGRGRGRGRRRGGRGGRGGGVGSNDEQHPDAQHQGSRSSGGRSRRRQKRN